MSDNFEHNPGDHEDPLAGPTWIIGFLGAVLLAVIMLGLTALYYNEQAEEEKVQIVEREPMELENLRREQTALLNQPPRRVEESVKVEGQDKEQIVEALAIPIDQAIGLTVRAYAKPK